MIVIETLDDVIAALDFMESQMYDIRRVLDGEDSDNELIRCARIYTHTARVSICDARTAIEDYQEADNA